MFSNLFVIGASASTSLVAGYCKVHFGFGLRHFTPIHPHSCKKFYCANQSLVSLVLGSGLLSQSVLENLNKILRIFMCKSFWKFLTLMNFSVIQSFFCISKLCCNFLINDFVAAVCAAFALSFPPDLVNSTSSFFRLLGR